MNDTHEVISAFLDEEPFDLRALDTALSDPAGRALLIDLVSLRRMVQPVDPIPVAHHVNSMSWLSPRSALAAAAIVLALIGGYVLGGQRAASTASQAPRPTRIVEVNLEWHTVPAGGIR
jgi:hypothetical protein